MSLGIEHYLESGEVPNDPETLAKLFQEATTGEAESEPDKKGVEDEKASSAAPGASESGEADKGKDEERADGIASKNGKHIIPYDVLETERQQKIEAQRRADELQAEIDRLKNNPNGSATQADLPVFNSMTEEQLEELKEFFPAQYEAIVAQQAAVLAANAVIAEAKGKLSTYEQQEAAKRAELEREAAKSAQAEIDNNPLLSHWQRNNPEIFKECCELDDKLRANPANANLTITERFTKVANAMKEIYGNPVQQQDSGKQEDQKVDKKTEAKPDKPMPFYSLSDIPGGEAPEASERQRLEDANSVELGNRFMSMTEDQRAAFLNSLG
jgi:hypothetical protein